MKIFSLALVAFGLVALFVGGVRYAHQTSLLELGPFRTATAQTQSIPSPVIIGGIALIAGVILLTAARRRLV